jgi:hypothetical protein
MNFTDQVQCCHSERSEESQPPTSQILRCAQNDKTDVSQNDKTDVSW